MSRSSFSPKSSTAKQSMKQAGSAWPRQRGASAPRGITRVAADKKIIELQQRIDREARERNELPPVEAYAAEDVLAITDSDIANAQRLAARHGKDLRFTPERGDLVWDGRRWAVDERGVQVQARAKETALSIFDEIKDSADRDVSMKHAKRSQSKNAIEATIWL